MKTNVTQNICEKVTEKLVKMIESGVNPWRKPWATIGGGSEIAISHTTGKPYSLLNQILLGFRSGEYLTFNQVQAEGGKVKKGAKSEMIVFWATSTSRKVKKVDEVTGEESEDIEVREYSMPILKYYNVFHVDDCEGIKAKHATEKTEFTPYDFEKDTKAEELAEGYVARSGVKLTIKESDKAYYRPSTDEVVVPAREQYENKAEFYSTLFHELTHSTGHKSRLDRFKIETATAARGKEYSREELVAEIGATTILAQLGINTDESDENSAAYLEGWASYLKGDPKAFIVAAGKAEKAVKMIVGE